LSLFFTMICSLGIFIEISSVIIPILISIEIIKSIIHINLQEKYHGSFYDKSVKEI
jgi:hypothetical protein